MDINSNFWNSFIAEDEKILGIRAVTMKEALKRLDAFNRPVLIVETGSARTDAIGDGQSTLLFEKYLKLGPGGKLITVDLNPDATKFCNVRLDPKYSKAFTNDSVSFLKNFINYIPNGFEKIDLLYLDSYDVDMNAPHDSALHHIYELVAAKPYLTLDTLVLIDDSPQNYNMCMNLEGQYQLLNTPRPWGKGMYVAEYAEKIGAETLAKNYQLLYRNL
jgi:hypothetical protein